jgi:hypothetical protein
MVFDLRSAALLEPISSHAAMISCFLRVLWFYFVFLRGKAVASLCVLCGERVFSCGIFRILQTVREKALLNRRPYENWRLI